MNLHISRRELLQASAATAAATGAEAVVAAVTDVTQGRRAPRPPVLFIGHGSPMNAINDNGFTRTLATWGQALPRPKALLVVSAHWLTPGQTRVGTQAQPRTIHDFGGFPQALFDIQYPAPGHPKLAQAAVDSLKRVPAAGAEDWGLDHGTWSVLRRMWPAADIPTFQVSIDYAQPARFHLAVGRDLAALRDQGVMIIGSGNIVHNLRATERQAADSLSATQPWAASFDRYVASALAQADAEALLMPRLPAATVTTAVPTPDHYFPLLYAVGAAGSDSLRTVFEGFQAGTLSMRSLQFG